MEGYIIIHKRLLEWQYYQNPNMVRLFLHLLLIADKEGRIVTTHPQLSIETGISEKVIRNCLDKLEKGRLLGRQRTNKNTIITIYEYDSYTNTKKVGGQTKGRQTGRQNESKSLTNQQANLERRKEAFTEELRPYVQIYGRDMVNEFWKYWTEPNKGKTKMRFEQERT